MCIWADHLLRIPDEWYSNIGESLLNRVVTEINDLFQSMSPVSKHIFDPAEWKWSENSIGELQRLIWICELSRLNLKSDMALEMTLAVWTFALS
jgi:hypothetical protein